MSAEKIAAEKRTEFGKGAARRIRRDNKIPAVVYEHGNDPIHLTLPGHVTMMAIRNGGSNALIELDIEGAEQLALIKDVQVDPIRRLIEHVDLFAVTRGEKVTVFVPIQIVGEAIRGTLVVTDLAELEIQVEATNVPDHIEVSIAGAEAGTQFLAGDLPLPEGSTLLTDPTALVVNVTEQAAEVVEESATEDGAEEATA